MNGSSYQDLIDQCDLATKRLGHLIRLYKAMLRAVNREDIANQLSKSKDKENLNYLLGLSSHFAVLAHSQNTIKDMVYVHCWSIYETWMKDAFQGWFLLEPERLDTKIKLEASKILKSDDITRIRIEIIRQQFREYNWDGPTRLLCRAEEAFGFSAYRNNECKAIEQAWLARAKLLRNEVVHGPKSVDEEKPELFRWFETGVQNDFIIRCIYRQVFVIQQVQKELMVRNLIHKKKLATDGTPSETAATEDIFKNVPIEDWKSVWGQSEPKK